MNILIFDKGIKILRFCLPNRSIQDLSDRVKEETEYSTSGVDFSVPLTHHDPRDLRLICSVKKRKIRFRIEESNLGFSIVKNGTLTL